MARSGYYLLKKVSVESRRLRREIVTLSQAHPRYGYRRITALLRHAGWQVGKDRVERIWRREGLKVPKKQKPRGRLWLNDGSCVRLRPERVNHVWSYDFVSGRTHDGRRVRMLNLIDEHTRESLLVRPERRWSAAKVIEALADVMVRKGVPQHIRSDNGPEFVAKDLRKWLAGTGAKTLYIQPGSPWELSLIHICGCHGLVGAPVAAGCGFFGARGGRMRRLEDYSAGGSGASIETGWSCAISGWFVRIVEGRLLVVG